MENINTASQMGLPHIALTCWWKSAVNMRLLDLNNVFGWVGGGGGEYMASNHK